MGREETERSVPNVKGRMGLSYNNYPLAGRPVSFEAVRKKMVMMVI